MKFRLTVSALTLSFLAVSQIAGCGGNDATPAAPIEPAAFTLQLLHLADMDGSDTTALDSVASMSGLITQFRSQFPSQTLVVSSGDNYIPGPRFNASNDTTLTTTLGTPEVGRADIAFLNAMGVQASTIGNHELDLGTRQFTDIIRPSGTSTTSWQGALFPFLSYNVDFTKDTNTTALRVANGGNVAAQSGKLSGWSTVTVGTETIGIIGAGSPVFKSITSVDGLDFKPTLTGSNVDVDGLAAEIQRGVDEMTTAGINKIVLLAHMQTIDTEKALATKLRNVDIIVAGGSNTLLADANDKLRVGASALGVYPFEAKSASGQPVVVVNVESDYKYLGRFMAPFNSQGVLIPGRFDTVLSGAWVTEETTPANAVTKVVQIRDALKSILTVKDGTVFGKTSVYLDGRRASVRNQETNFGNLTADANLWYAKLHTTATISLKNGGGIRSEIGEVLAAPGSTSGATLTPPKANPSVGRAAGEVSQLAIETALKFNNKLWVFDVTATQLKVLLEHGVASLGTQGRFPQVGGMSFSYDATQTAQVLDSSFAVTTAGQRIRSLKIGTDVVVQNGAIVGAANRTFRLVTLNFLAGRGDGYPFPLKASLVNLIELDVLMTSGTAGGAASTAIATLGSEQDALMKYLKSLYQTTPFNVTDTAEENDLRIQNIAKRTDTVLP